MIVKVYFTDRICMRGVRERISMMIEVKKVGKNRLDRTVKAKASQMFPDMHMNTYEVVTK